MIPKRQFTQVTYTYPDPRSSAPGPTYDVVYLVDATDLGGTDRVELDRANAVGAPLGDLLVINGEVTTIPAGWLARAIARVWRTPRLAAVEPMTPTRHVFDGQP